MHLPTLLSTCALALTANAVLVPPQAAPADKEFWDAAKDVMVAEPRKTINLPCPGCPVALAAENGRPGKWSEGSRTELEMEFVAENGQIKMNGQPFYPPTRQNIALPKTVKQVYAADEANRDGSIFDGPIAISTSVDVHEKMEIATVKMGALVNGDEDPLTKTPMRRISFEILGLADKVVHVDTIELLISESDENLLLFGLNTTPYAKHATPEGDACSTVFCRVRATIKAKLTAWRLAAAAKLAGARHTCMRKIKAICGALRLPVPRPHSGISRLPKLHGGLPKFTGDATLAPGGKNHPHGPWSGNKNNNNGGHHRGHHGHHHHRHGGARHALRVVGRFFRHVMLPIFVGVAAGLAVSAIGMVIGQIAVMLFARRRAAAGYQSVEQTEENRTSFEELPKYEEAPEYEEAPAYVDEKREDGN